MTRTSFALACIGIVAAVLSTSAPAALAGEVVLENGDVLTGEVRVSATQVEVRHATLGRVLLERARIREVRGDVAGPIVEPAGPVVAPSAAPLPPAPCPPPPPPPPPCPPPVPPCAPPCEKPWKFRVSGAVSLATGNSDSLDVKADVSAVRKPDPWGLKFGLAYVYGEKDSEVSTDQWHGIARVDRVLNATSCSYVFGQVLWDRDEIAGLEDRFTGVAGYGRNLLKRPGEELKGEIGGGATYEKREGEDATTDPAAYLGLHYFKEWADKTRFTTDLDVLPNLGDFDLSVAHLLVGYEIPMNTALRILFGMRADYVVDPPGDTESLDLLLTAGVGVEF